MRIQTKAVTHWGFVAALCILRRLLYFLSGKGVEKSLRDNSKKDEECLKGRNPS